MITALFCTVAFVLSGNRSVLDTIRLFVVVFFCLRQYPFPDKWLWTFLRYYSTVVLILRTLYDLPIVCAGLQLRSPRPQGEKRLPFEPEDSYSWCPVFTEIGYDILLGLAKRSTSSSLDPSQTWIDVVWADHFVIWAVLMHQWLLERYGVGRFVTFDWHSHRLWLRKEGAPTAHSPAESSLELRGQRLGSWTIRFREEHIDLVNNWWKLRKDFLAEFETQDELFHQYMLQLEDVI
ncbi:unnamed protein product [Effrenium voratum]|nr:unnamed protein product [Effrenium voratum]